MKPIVVQMLVLCAAMFDTGFTTTLTVNIAPFVHAVGEVGVTLYTAVTGKVVVLARVAVTDDGVSVYAAPPVKPAPVGAFHLYVVPDGTTPVGV